MAQQAVAGTSTARGRFGTFAGVFTPNILTILGIILFLRTGWVVGEAGLWGALIIIGIANSISLLTGLSLSAIATSMDVGAGGNYYLISRSLGLEIGGAIGIPLYLSQAISVAFYLIGFTEAVMALAFFQAFDPRLIAAIMVVLFGVIAYIGADFALKIQYFILVVLVSALISFFAGGWDSFIRPNLLPNYSAGVNFWAVFAVFFPAVTGIEVGISLSGDLKEPGKSIPRGTLAAIGVTSVVYVAAAIWFAYHLTAEQLITDALAMQQVARWPALILFGVWASTLSSALGSVLAAPRTLEAVAMDDVVPGWLASRLGSATEPRMAVLVTTVVAIAIVMIGDLNVVAPVITMFFLNTYGMVNLAAGIERLVGNPSYRPKFDIPWYFSLLGAFGCYGAMFLINAPATIVAIVVSYSIYIYLERRQFARTWGDVRSGLWLSVIRYALLTLEAHRSHPKNWRPNLLVFTGQPHNREQLVEVADWLSLGRGIVTFFHLIVADVTEAGSKGLRRRARSQIQKYIDARGMQAFAEAEIVSDFKSGALTMAQGHGIGAIEPNSVVMGWSRTAEGRALQMELTYALAALRKSVIFLRYDYSRGYGQRNVINIWWGGRGGNADLNLLLAHLIVQHRSWTNARIRLLRVITGEEGVAQTRAHLQRTIEEVRVDADPIVIVRPSSSTPLAEVIAAHSDAADLTLLGMRLPAPDEAEAYSERIHTLMEQVGTVLLVHNAQHDEDLLTTG